MAAPAKKITILETQPVSAEEAARLEQLRASHPTYTAPVHYLTYLRYLRGYVNDPRPMEKSIEMLGKMLAWRQQENVDAILTTDLPRADEFKAIWPTGTHGFGKDGNLIYVDRTGSVSPSKLSGSGGFTIEEVKRFHVQQMERVNRLKEEQYDATGVTKYKNLVILDLEGIGMSHLGSKFLDPLKSFLKIDQEYYPESLYQMVITNAGFIVKTVWAMISPFIDPITKERIKFGEKHLPEIIDVEQIPKFLGGKCKCKDGKCLIEPFVAGYPEGDPRNNAPGTTAAASSSGAPAAAAAAPAAASTVAASAAAPQ